MTIKEDEFFLDFYIRFFYLTGIKKIFIDDF